MFYLAPQTKHSTLFYLIYVYISVGLLWWTGTSGLYGNQLYKTSKVSIYICFIYIKLSHCI